MNRVVCTEQIQELGKEEKREGFYRKGRGRWGRMKWRPGIGQIRTGRVMHVHIR